MLGLRRGTVRLQPHDPEWLEAATEIRSQIGDASGLPPDRIQHIGSTAVPGLPAKPILDIDLGLLDSDDHKQIVLALVSNGFIDRGYKSEGIGHLLVRESKPEVRTVHVHVVRYNSPGWRRDLAFRDALRRHPSLRERYANLKIDLAERFPTDRTAYRRRKNAFFEILPDSGIESAPKRGSP